MSTLLRITVLLALLVLPYAASAQAPLPTHGLPAGALVIERQVIKSKSHPDRALVLWMLKPKRNARPDDEDIYTCPEETRGSHYSGPTRVSLVNTRTGRIINTVMVKSSYMDDEDTFDIPYRIHDGYYHVPNVTGRAEGTPVIMLLRDYNGDGRAAEFALFDALACMGLNTTLIGYSETQDRVIQYPVQIQVREGRKLLTQTRYWTDYLFGQKPVRPGYWKYEIDYRGRAGTLDQYEIRYNRLAERFEGRLTSTADE